MADAGGSELERARRMLAAAQLPDARAGERRANDVRRSQSRGRSARLPGRSGQPRVGATHGEPWPYCRPGGLARSPNLADAHYSPVDTHEAMLTLELNPSLLRML